MTNLSTSPKCKAHSTKYQEALEQQRLTNKVLQQWHKARKAPEEKEEACRAKT